MDDEGVKIHLWPIEDVFDQFNPAGEKGLTQQRADQLLEQHGPNELEKPPPPPCSLSLSFSSTLSSCTC